ncbi:hypothetical protein AWH62_14785 [Maricaulis sp. W15]|nr:hypothetical protein AWH62_14785 [Maricaulis sp. W15]
MRCFIHSSLGSEVIRLQLQGFALLALAGIALGLFLKDLHRKWYRKSGTIVAFFSGLIGGFWLLFLGLYGSA